MARATPDDIVLLEDVIDAIKMDQAPGGLLTRLERLVQRMREDDALRAGKPLHIEVDADSRTVYFEVTGLVDVPYGIQIGVPFCHMKRCVGLILEHEAEQDRIVREAEGKPHTLGNEMKAAAAKNLIAEADAEVSASRASVALQDEAPKDSPPTERRQIPGVDY